MKKLFVFLALFVSIIGYSIFSQASHGPYNPDRDPFKDFELAQIEAAAHDKLILIQIGGNWCSWCIKLERFFIKNPTIADMRDEVFVSMKVNVSPENYNEDFLSQLPEFEGYPFLVITDEDGQVLNSKTSGNFEEGSGYSTSKFKEYFDYWKNADIKPIL